jgi:hypothetical protein
MTLSKSSSPRCASPLVAITFIWGRVKGVGVKGVGFKGVWVKEVGVKGVWVKGSTPPKCASPLVAITFIMMMMIIFT